MSDKQTITEHTVNNGKKFSRRDFLKLAGAGALTTAVLTADNPFSPEYKINSSMLVLDLFNLPEAPESDDIEALAYGYYKKTYGGHGEMVVDVMQKTGVELGEDLTNKQVEYVSIYPALSINEIKKDDLGNITAVVEISEDKIIKLIGQSNASIVNMSFEVGKTTISAELYREQEVFIEGKTRSDLPSESKQKITVNGVTTESVVYRDPNGKIISKDEFDNITNKVVTRQKIELAPEDRIITHEDGYAGEYTYENLLKLTKIAAKFPDKLFVAAGGNPDPRTGKRPDIREARKKLEEQGLWMNNLIMIGYTDTNPKTDNVEPMQFGSDYYVDTNTELKLLGHEGSSSAGTAFTSKFISRITEGDSKKINQIKEEIDAQSKTKSVFIGEPIYDTITYEQLDYGKG